MNALTQNPSQISEEDYLARYAQESDTRYEYINGEIWAMAGASRNHNIIAGNAYAALHSQLKNHPCQAFISDWRVQAQHNYYYPDVVIDCQAQGNSASQPVLIIEVLSDSTRQTDLTLKLHDYRQIQPARIHRFRTRLYGRPCVSPQRRLESHQLHPSQRHHFACQHRLHAIACRDLCTSGI